MADDSLSIVVVAAGAGSRMGSKVNKQFLLLEDKPVLAYSLEVFERHPWVDKMIVVSRAEDIDYVREEIVEKYEYHKVAKIIAGGAMRQDSAWAGLQALGEDTEYVAVHDGARPLLTGMLLSQLLDEARKWGGAIPGTISRDTLKVIDHDGFISHTLDREQVVAVQTPQVFLYKELIQAYKRARDEGFTGTDDAALFSRYIGKVRVILSKNNNLKITIPEDIAIVSALLESGGQLDKE